MTFESLKNKFFDIDLARKYYDVLRVLIKPQDIFLVATEEGQIFVVAEEDYKKWTIGIGCPPDIQYEVIKNALIAGHVGLETKRLLLKGEIDESQETTNVHTLRR